MKMTKAIQAFAVSAYRAMNTEDRDDYPTHAFYEARKDREQYLDFLMLRRHWYYGEWVFFELGVYGCTFDGAHLAELMAAEDAAKKQAAASTVTA